MPVSSRNPLVHGSNLEQKENHRTKYRDADSKRYLSEIRVEYNKWKLANSQLVGPTATPTNKDDEVIFKRIELLSEYKDFLDARHYAEKFDSRSNLHSSVLEEFLYYLFRDLAKDFGRKCFDW